ncbi:TetR/AcrR family transcriptional regulator [Paenalkalicoccus suaedae]|uniref:TetR/AcrR family transcriptional regulator n=1 Tax=Paenalkalicoccus suaedae TaxID=2592382 RepID=A0A859FIQ5_9BACI|nr:TetR/AcrR family transcriptional regulator [Paenalkalicoccus suaedae]QKS72790.1 TetR/AcrR family transcriptional regulator [Paenalkalicoccus suaedae]
MRKKDVPSLVKDPHLIDMRRAQIVKAAVQLFNEKGYHKATTRAVAEASGFSIGTLYEYIGSKEDILYLVCDSVYDEVISRWEELLDEKLTGRERLSQVIEAYFRVVNDLQDEVLVMYQESKSLSEEALRYVLEKELRMKRMFEQELTRAKKEGLVTLTEGEMSLAAHQILVAGHMWTFRRWAIQRDYSIEEYITYQLRQLFTGFGMKEISSS